MNTASPAAGKSGPDSRSSDEIEGEIEDTRERLTRTLDALEDKLSPRKRLHDAAESVINAGARWSHAVGSALTPDITSMIRMDHTHALMLFRRYRPGVSSTRRAAIIENACLALEIHATLEEEIFYPAMVELLGDNEVFDKSEPEHARMRQLIASLRRLPRDSAARDDAFRELMRTVLHHVADEESVLLPRAEELMGERLGELGRRMAIRRMELLQPHMAHAAVTTAQSFPLATAAFATGALALLWFLLRPPRRRLD